MRLFPCILPALMISTLAFAAPKTAAKAAPLTPAVYQPDLTQWRLEITPDLGGWTLEGKQELRIKLVDPKDPNPPQEEARRSYEDDYYEGDGGEGGDLDSDKTAEQLKQERLVREAESRNNAWRSRNLQVWLNGDTTELNVRVGYATMFQAESQNGENRLEIWEKDSGKRVVRTWWANGSKARLRIHPLSKAEEEWNSGHLEILEPNGDLASQGRRTNSGGTLSWSGEYLHPTPAMGTYTLRWTGGYRGAKPFKVTLEAILDGGTEQERRWVFERLILPGAGPVTLGTLDVEN